MRGSWGGGLSSSRSTEYTTSPKPITSHQSLVTKQHTKHMNTKNHQPATTSDILNTKSNNPPSEEAQPNNPQIHKSTNPFALRARCGKVARLPKEIRDQINEMLLDGVPHAQIIQKLKQTFAPRNAPIPVGADSNLVPPLSSVALLAKEDPNSLLTQWKSSIQVRCNPTGCSPFEIGSR